MRRAQTEIQFRHEIRRREGSRSLPSTGGRQERSTVVKLVSGLGEHACGLMRSHRCHTTSLLLSAYALRFPLTSRGGGRRGRRSASDHRTGARTSHLPALPRLGLCGRGREAPTSSAWSEAPQHSLGCANCHLRADRLLVAQIRACSRLLSPTPFFFF